MRFPFRAGVSALIGLGAMMYISVYARASARPRAGGMLRMEISARVQSLDPETFSATAPDAAAKQRLLALAFDALIELDAAGQPRPALALAWKVNADQTRWDFALRSGVKFHDGTALDGGTVAAALQKQFESWKFTPTANSVVIQCSEAQPNLLYLLALAFIYRRDASGGAIGTGAFRVVSWQAGERAVFSANESYWGGRPFVDGIEVRMGQTHAEQWAALELGKTDVVELPPTLLRRAAQSERKISTSDPVVLYQLHLTGKKPAMATADFREALSLAIDRQAIHSVLLQKQGEVAGGCLPQWLSGYSALFSTERNLEAARKLLGTMKPPLPTMTLAYAATDPLARSVAERVAVNARDAGIVLQLKARAEGTTSPEEDIVLLRRHVVLPAAFVAMEFTCPATRGSAYAIPARDWEKLYQLEVESQAQAPHLIPLFYLPESFALSARVKNWMPTRWGAWRLADVWLENRAEGAAQPGNGEKP
ncbi:MAG TPA: ABC transporter substrate-binding protein [Candidatus Nitrosotenuis sp.]|nr:ABC transporter substrate-binding protein [Candidatus Nitrosotenuis sp.]